MHEVSLMEAAMDSIVEAAHANGAKNVSRVVLRVGKLAGVDTDALQLAFEVVRKETPAATADLEIVAVDAKGRCADCDIEFNVGNDFYFACPRCGRVSDEVLSGRELEIARIEIS